MGNSKGTRHYKKKGISSKSIVKRGYQKKVWQSSKHSLFNQDNIDWLINNDLPLNEEFSKLDNRYVRTGKYKGQLNNEYKKSKKNHGNQDL